MSLIKSAEKFENFGLFLSLSKDNVLLLDDLQKSLGETKRVKVVETARALKAAGFGKFVVGRRKFPSRFEWEYTTESLTAHLADPETPLLKVERATPNVKGGKLTIEARAGGHDCQLRPGVVIDLSTLANLDLSDEEKETLTDAIATL